MIYDYFLYIDPGSMNALFAVMLGAIVGAGFFIKTKFQSLRLKKMDK